VVANLDTEVVKPPIVFVDPPENGAVFGGSRLLFREAARHFGVNLTDQEDHDWLVGLEAGMLIDHLVDVEKENVNLQFRAIIEGNLRQDLYPDAQIRAINYMARLNPEARQIILGYVDQVNELAIAQRQATRAQEVADIRITEADIFAAILSVHESDGPDAQARQRFNRWLQGFSRTGYTLDTLVDMREDFASGESGVAPTAAARVYYGKIASREALSAMRKTPLSLLGRCALVGANYVVKQKKLSIQNI